MPEIDTEIIHAPDLPTLGMGECTFGPTAAAIGNAVAHALGTRIRDMPFTRERIEAALAEVSGADHAFTSGQPPSASGRHASSGGMDTTSLQ